MEDLAERQYELINLLGQNVESFEEVFVAVCEAKIGMDVDSLRRLKKDIREYSPIKSDAIVYLLDVIDLEIMEQLRIENERQYIEKKMQTEIINNFNKLFPKYTLVDTEHVVKSGRIDILAEENQTKRTVIIELKTNKKNPANQLLGYSKEFIKPTLIGITQEPVINKIEGITYFVYKNKQLYKQ